MAYAVPTKNKFACLADEPTADGSLKKCAEMAAESKKKAVVGQKEKETPKVVSSVHIHYCIKCC